MIFNYKNLIAGKLTKKKSCLVAIKDNMDIDEYESLPTTSVGVNMTAGASAGIMEHCIMYPVDSVKVMCIQ